jgi:hypothetical protein
MNDEDYRNLYHNVIGPIVDERDRLRAFAEWIISLDDDDPNSPGRKERQTITLTKIIEKAKGLV